MASIETAYSDYRQLVSSLKEDDLSKADVYEQIMSKEQDRINLINRVVDQKSEQLWQGSLFYNKSIIDIVFLFASTLKIMFNEILVEKQFDKLDTILYTGDRKIYSGIMLVIVAGFLFFMNISD